MNAIVEIAGTQFEVEPTEIYYVPFIDAEMGEMKSFSNILLTQTDEGNVEIGAPYLDGNVEAKVLAHAKGDKVLVFKKKRRKGYRKLNGHRQLYTLIQITGINSGALQFQAEEKDILPSIDVLEEQEVKKLMVGLKSLSDAAETKSDDAEIVGIEMEEEETEVIEAIEEAEEIEVIEEEIEVIEAVSADVEQPEETEKSIDDTIEDSETEDTENKKN
ncbi:MAG: large subunit ribosomal protein [Bacteroidota bacterium]|nr:large subunit ribosomal protein [Bacteroidota bacterium]